MEKKQQQLEFYGKQGWPIFPIFGLNEDGGCSCGRPNCRSPGKHPITRDGYKNASTDLAVIRAWHKQHPDANWAMRTGSKITGGSGNLIVDLDGDVGIQHFENIEYEEGDPVYETIEVDTPNGRHIWFGHADDFEYSIGSDVLAPEVDIRGNFGYVLVPPSQTDRPYQYRIKPGEAEITPLPKWLEDRINGAKNTPINEKMNDIVPEGARHGTLVSLAGALRSSGFEQDAINASLMAVRDSDQFADGSHAVTDQEIQDISKWVVAKPKGYHLTDMGNGERFADQHHKNARYIYEWDSWICWDGKRWAINDLNRLDVLSFETVRSIYTEAANESTPAKRQKIGKWASRSEAKYNVGAMLHMAHPYLSTKPDELDKDTYLLNVANGTLNLWTGELVDHNPDHLITKMIDVKFDREAECPKWLEFLNMIMAGNQEDILYLQKAIGYSLTGNVDERCFFFLHGTGRNGKTTFTETLFWLLGEYACRTDIEALMMTFTRGRQATPYIADLQGRRLAIASEVPENRRLNEALLKLLTGGDTLTARYLHRNQFEFKPTHKIWIFGNHKPIVRDTSIGFWDRTHMIPFPVAIPKKTQRPMAEVLDEFRHEAPGILKWAVEGCLLWQYNRLEQTDSIYEATREYQTEQDIVLQFLTEKCDRHPEYSVLKNELWRAWKNWCEEAGEKAAGKRTKRWFIRQMIQTHDFKHAGDGRSKLGGVKLNIPF